MMSKNGIALIVFILSYLGVNVAEQEIIEAVAAITTVISFILMIWNQVKRPNVSWFIFKK